MPANYNRRMQQKAAQPLRPDSVPAQFSGYQMSVYAAFLSAVLSNSIGVYSSLVRNGGAIRLRLYSGDESYEDTIFPSDDLAYLLTDYATQFKVKEEFLSQVGRLHAGEAQRQSEARQEGAEGVSTAQGGSKPLRGSQGPSRA